MKSWAIANGESRRAEQILDQGNFKIPARESVLVQSATGTVDEQTEFARGGQRRVDLSRQPDVAAIISPIEYPKAGLISRDRRSVLVQFDVRGPRTRRRTRLRRSWTRSPAPRPGIRA